MGDNPVLSLLHSVSYLRLIPRRRSCGGALLPTDKASSLELVSCCLETPSYCSAKKQAGTSVRNKALAIHMFNTIP